MLSPLWRRTLRQLSSALIGGLTSRGLPIHYRGANARPLANTRLEELESRLAPASFAVNAQLRISCLDSLGDTSGGTHAVVFFESAVANYQVLQQGLGAGTDAVLLDSGGDGLREMAAFLAGRRDLTAIGVVAHGAPGAVALGTGTLDVESLSSYTRELAVVGSALARGGELDLWSCEVAFGQAGECLVGVAAATGAGVAAADHTIGSAAVGGNWQLDVRTRGARGEVPFTAAALGAFHGLLPWSSAASMATARWSFTGFATALVNGKVLVAGGFNSTSRALSSAELYNPVSNTWSTAGSMATERVHHTVTLLNNGKVLVVGGDSNSAYGLASAELYDPVNNTWSSAGSMATARVQCTATLLNNAEVLVTGGFGMNGPLSSAEVYDPVSNSWSSAGDMATARGQQTATLLGNGKVLVAGGSDASSILSSAELYDPVSNTWSPAASMATARSQHTATLLSNGKVLVAGGSGGGGASAELYDPVNNTWTTAASMATARGGGATATLLNNGKVLVAGGRGGAGDLSSAELYDPVSNTWSSTGSMSTPREFATTLLLNDGKVLVTGGEFYGAQRVFLASAELYDPAGASASQSTISVAPATIPVGGTSIVTLTSP